MNHAQESFLLPRDYEAPKFRVPVASCDSHTHVIPMGNMGMTHSSTYAPEPATIQSHTEMLGSLSLSRSVVVQPSIFGTNNTALLSAIAFAPKRLRGVAVVDSGVTDEELHSLHESGIRGVRFNILMGGGGGLESMDKLAPRLASMGWHAEVLIDGQQLPDVLEVFESLPCKLVIDHLGHLTTAFPINSKPVQALVRLVEERHTWVKISGTFRLAGNQSDLVLRERAIALAKLAPQRMIWGSDWPYLAYTSKPDAGALLNQIGEWFEYDDALLTQLLSANPAELYDFPVLEAEIPKNHTTG